MQRLQNELSPTFELKITSKIVPVVLDLVPKMEPTMTAAIIRIVNKQSGMANLFLRYQGRLINVMNNFIKNTVRKI
jgi:hypothetical protein